MRPSRRTARTAAGVPLLLAILLAACVEDTGGAGAGARASTPAADSALVAEARQFMEGYARDLLAGDRAAIAARYDSTGAFLLGNGRKEFMAREAIVAQYAGEQWKPPTAFEWRDLSFEPAGPDAVVVMGTFAWTPAGGPAPVVLSYASLLRRRGGALRIRMEDESVDPASIPRAAPSPRDSARR